MVDCFVQGRDRKEKRMGRGRKERKGRKREKSGKKWGKRGLMEMKTIIGFQQCVIWRRLYRIMMNTSQQIKIGHYILGKTLGSGGFAKVKTARHDLTNLEVAVKIINKKKMKNKNMISKVKREIRILKFINHPNIIKLYEVLDTTNDIYVIMELASQGELYYSIQRSLSEQEARFYFKQIINGVEYIHRNHISHRDLKPENILIDSNNIIKIGDFGLSNLMKDGKLMKTACGSPYYAAPEIVGERKYEGTSVDIWSAGVILYALVIGSLPFDDDNITHLYRQIERGIYKIPENTNKYAEDLIRRMLQVDPYNRISIPEIKVHPWMRDNIPIYLKLPDQFIIDQECQVEIDEDVLDKVKTLDLNFHEYSEDKIKKAILKRDDESFAIAYELLKSEKDRRDFAENHQTIDEISSTVLEKIPNFSVPTSPPAIDPEDDKFIYGKIFQLNARILLDRVTQTLTANKIEFQLKNSQFCVKCLHVNNRIKKKKEKNMEEEREEREQGGKQNKFTKQMVKFTAQIFEVDKKSQIHVLDFHLTQGHPMIFFPLASHLYQEIRAGMF